MTRICQLTLSATFLLTAVYAQQKTALDADEVVNLAVARNRDFLAVSERVREAEGLLRQAGIRPFATFDTALATGRPLGTTGEEQYSAGFSQPFERGGKRDRRTAAAELAVELARADVLEKRRQLAFDVKSKYAEAVAAQSKLEALAGLIRINRESYDLTNARVREGDAAPLEAALFLAETNKTTAQQATYRGRTVAALSELRRTAGLQPAEPMEIRFEFASLPKLPELDVIQSLARNRSDLRALRVGERQLEAETELAKAQGRADITGSARYSHVTSQLNAPGSPLTISGRDNILTVGISIPILTANRNKGAVDAAEARAAGARLRRQFLEGVVPQEVESAYRRLETARQTVQLLSDVIGQSEANLKVIRQGYTLGQFRVLDVLNEQRRLVDTKLSYIDAQLEEEQAQIELERATGGPIR